MWRSDDNARWVAGFSLFEAVIASMVLSFIAVSALSLFSGAAARVHRVQDQYLAMEVARSVLEEFIVTNDYTTLEGTYAGKWHWGITDDVDVSLDGKTSIDHLTPHRLTITVSLNGTALAELSRIIIRGAGQ